MDYNTLLLYVLTVTALISTPGPVVMLVMNTSLRQGPVQGMKTIIGTNMASLILIIVAALIINQVLTINPFILSMLKVLGCLYIIYIACDSLRSLPIKGASLVDAKKMQENLKETGFQVGFMVGISNPKDIVFFASFFPQFINIAHTKNASLAVLAVVWMILDLFILFCYVLLMSQKQIHQWRRMIILFSSVCLLGVALIGLAHSVHELIKVY